jgi:hypothetical protein
MLWRARRVRQGMGTARLTLYSRFEAVPAGRYVMRSCLGGTARLVDRPRSARSGVRDSERQYGEVSACPRLHEREASSGSGRARVCRKAMCEARCRPRRGFAGRWVVWLGRLIVWTKAKRSLGPSGGSQAADVRDSEEQTLASCAMSCRENA